MGGAGSVFAPIINHTTQNVPLSPQNIPTVKAFSPFDAEKDAGALKSAMKGFGCDNDEITKIMGNRTANQRHEIGEAYKNLFGRDLIDDLKSELGGNFERLVIALMHPWPQFCARVLKKACQGAGTDVSGRAGQEFHDHSISDVIG